MISKKFLAPPGLFSKKAPLRISSSHLRANVFPNEVGHGRFAVSIGTKIDKKSVVRHSLKRTILDAAFSHKELPFDFVMIPLPSAAKATRAEMVNDVSALFAKVK